ncbi:MAG: NCS2 family permease [Ignavibacteriales bacterium]|nr:NCS2 family permease [Ignavibacteriales bacterium]
MLEKLFKLSENQTSIRTEVVAGLTTFMTMSYIIFVQPAVLAQAGMDFGAVMTATCIASAIGTFLMGFMANYPVAMAPAMGHNFFFAFMICGPIAMGGMGYPWQVALGANFIAGALFIIISRWGIRELIMTVIPESLKHAIAVGIGLLIAFLGLQWGGIVVDSPGTLVTMGNLGSPVALLTLIGTIVIAILMACGINGAIFWGIVTAAIVGIPFGIVKCSGEVISMPPSVESTFLKLNIIDLFTHADSALVIFILFFLAVFDTVGTLVGVGQRAGLMKDGKLPRARQALLADAIGTTAGTLLGTSTVTSYIESTAGVSVGGRTGLANMVTGIMFLLALFFAPIVKIIGGGFEVSPGVFLYPVTAPALIIVGSLMLQSVKHIVWDDVTETIPAFLTIVIMQLAFSITEGIAFGFISFALLKLVSGKTREVHWLVYLLAILFLLRYIFLKA